MAFRFNGTNNSLAQTASLPSNNWTMCAWVRPNAMAAASDAFLSAGDTTARALNFGAVGGVWRIDDTGVATANFAITPKNGEWWFAAMSHDGTNCRGFTRRWDYRSLQFATIAAAALTLTSMKIGNSTFDGTDWGDGRIAGWRIWSRQLSIEELLLESFSLAPRSRARIHTCAQEDSRVDLSGFARTLTAAGTVTREQGPLVYNNQIHILDRVNTAAAATSADLSSAGAASATFATQSTASANISSSASASAVFSTNALWPAAISVAGTAASTVFGATSQAKADISVGGSAIATFTTVSTASVALVMAGAAAATFSTVSTASANLSMSGGAAATLASAATASADIAMAGVSSAIFGATSTSGSGSSDLAMAGSASAVFAAQSNAFADLLSSGSSSVVFDATTTGGTPVVETITTPMAAGGGAGYVDRSRRRKRQDEEHAGIVDALGPVLERMVRGGLIEDEIEIPMRMLH